MLIDEGLLSDRRSTFHVSSPFVKLPLPSTVSLCPAMFQRIQMLLLPLQHDREFQQFTRAHLLILCNGTNYPSKYTPRHRYLDISNTPQWTYYHPPVTSLRA